MHLAIRGGVSVRKIWGSLCGSRTDFGAIAAEVEHRDLAV